MKPKLIDAPYQHNCELADEYSVLSNRTGCIRKSVISVLTILLKLIMPGEKPRYYVTGKQLICKSIKSYIYDHSVMIETIASKHNLVCRQTVFNSILTSTLFVGFTVGSGLGGYLSDKYGQVEIPVFELRSTRAVRTETDIRSDQS